MTKRTVVAVIAVASGLLSACGDDQTAEQQESATRELQQAQRELREERRRLKREREKEESSPETSSADEPSSGTGGSGGGTRGKVPDVEGEDHQLAQDKMQAAGFYNLSEEDASGEDRPLLFDRNWTVVSQSPKAGTRASLDRTIVLKAKKDGE